MTDAIYLTSLNRPSKTKKVLEQLITLQKYLNVQEFEDCILKIAKKTKTTKKDVKEVEKMVQVEKIRTKTERSKRVTGVITAESIAKQFGLSVETVRRVAMNYAKTKGGTYETVIKSKLGNG